MTPRKPVPSSTSALSKNVLVTLVAFAMAVSAADFAWDIPQGFPRPSVPTTNPMSPAKAGLGRYLFYDKRMSANGKKSCASCSLHA